MPGSAKRTRRRAIRCHYLPAVRIAGGAARRATWPGVALSYSMLYNLLGMPAGVVAATRVRPGEESDHAAQPGRRRTSGPRRQRLIAPGLPVGVRIVARHSREDVLLAVMAGLEAHFAGRRDYPADSP